MNIDLVTRLQNGDAEALREVQQIYRTRIYAHALRVVRDPWDAEEVVQDVLWTVYRKVGSLDQPETFESWMFRITRNACLMLLRKRKRVPTPVEDEVVELASRETAHNPHEPDRVLARQQALQSAQEAYDSLKPICQQIFYEMDIEGRDKEELAAELGITIPSLKSRLHRARVTIRQAFDAPLVV